MIPFALELYRRYLEGESADALATDTGIPIERIQQRLQAAAEYVARSNERRNAAGGGSA